MATQRSLQDPHQGMEYTRVQSHWPLCALRWQSFPILTKCICQRKILNKFRRKLQACILLRQFGMTKTCADNQVVHQSNQDDNQAECQSDQGDHRAECQCNQDLCTDLPNLQADRDQAQPPNLTSLWKLQYTSARSNVTHTNKVAHAT